VPKEQNLKVWELQEKLEKEPDDLESQNGIEEYEMESQLFDYDAIRKQDNFGIKKYSDAIFRGEL
jgi:hypothetical protein